jgi:hypothetical protein
LPTIFIVADGCIICLATAVPHRQADAEQPDVSRLWSRQSDIDQWLRLPADIPVHRPESTHGVVRAGRRPVASVWCVPISMPCSKSSVGRARW